MINAVSAVERRLSFDYFDACFHSSGGRTFLRIFVIPWMSSFRVFNGVLAEASRTSIRGLINRA